MHAKVGLLLSESGYFGRVECCGDVHLCHHLLREGGQILEALQRVQSQVPASRIFSRDHYALFFTVWLALLTQLDLALSFITIVVDDD